MNKKLLLLFALTFSSFIVLAQEISVSADIREVKSFGQWSANEQYGNYRIVIVNHGYEHVSNTVYLQWISTDNDSYKVIKSIIVSELSKDSFYSVSVKRVEPEKIILYLVDSHSFEKSELEIIPVELGKYKANAV